MHAPAAAGILPSEFSRTITQSSFAPDFAQRAGDARQHAGRAYVRILIEPLADRQPQAPQGDMIGNVGRADRAEQNGVELPQLVGADQARIITPCVR